MSAILKFDFQKRKQLHFSEVNYLNYTKKTLLHVATSFSLKQGETRTSHGPILHPLMLSNIGSFLLLQMSYDPSKANKKCPRMTYLLNLRFSKFTLKSPCVTQRSVSQENAFKKRKTRHLSPPKTTGSNNSFTLIENNFRFLR